MTLRWKKSEYAFRTRSSHFESGFSIGSSRDSLSDWRIFRIGDMWDFAVNNVFIPKNRPFDESQMERRISQILGESPEDQAYFSTAEDIILAKLEWFRPGGETSERQWRDILGVLDLQSSRLDFEYLRKWASSLAVNDLLEKAISETK